MEYKNNFNDTIGSDHAPHLKENKEKNLSKFTFRNARCSNSNASYVKSC